MKNVFIIVNYNDFENTYKLINNIKDYKIIDNILVVDNCSIDTSFYKLTDLNFKKLTILKTENNNGYSSAINFAAKYCEKMYKDCNLIISNSDIEIKKEQNLSDLIKALNENKETAIIAPKINQHGIISYGWRIPNIFEALILNIPKFNKYYENKFINYNKNYFDKPIKEVEVVSGCFFIMKLSSLIEVNYFDENIFLYYEENTISTKLKKINKKIIINTNIEVLHNHSQTINKNFNEYKKLKELKISQYYFYKYIKKTNKLLLGLLKISNNIFLKIKKVKVGAKN